MSSAFVIIDVQKTWTDNNPLTGKRINAAARSLRDTMPIIWVYMTRKDEGHPVTQARPGIIAEMFNTLTGSYKPTYHPSHSDFVVTKQEPNGFAGTNLEDFLKNRHIEKLYFSGFLSSQCVFSTAANAAILGFDSHIVTDLTSDYQDKGPIFWQNESVIRAVECRGSHAKVKMLESRDIGLNLA